MEKKMKVISKDVGEKKCPLCNWRISRLYGFNCDPEKEMLCGDCFCDRLLEKNYEVEK